MDLNYKYFEFDKFDPLYIKYKESNYNENSIDDLYGIWKSNPTNFENYKINLTHFLCFNPDLANESVNNLIEMYEKLGNNAKKIINIDLENFNYKDYISLYPDLNDLTYGKAYVHWIEFGQREERISKKKICNFNLNIVVILHLYHTELLIEMKQYIREVICVFEKTKVIVTINEDKKDEYLDFGFPVEIIYIPNKGVDVYPFIKCIEYINNNNIECDFLLKLHTKKTSRCLEKLPNWRQSLSYPITEYFHLRNLQFFMEKYKDKIGVISSQECIMNKEYDDSWPYLVSAITSFLNKFPNLPNSYTSFNGGNIFWINFNLIKEYMTDEIIKYISSNCSYGRPNENNSIEYVCERLFSGILPNGKLNILVNNNFINGFGLDIKLDQRVFSVDKGCLNLENY